MDLDLETYARVMAELLSGPPREAVLARHGLTEESWSAVDTHWQDRLSEALADEEEGVHPLLAAYLAAYEAAQKALASPITIEQFAEVTRLLQATGDVRAALSRVGVSLSDFVQGSEHWSRRIAQEPEVEQRFEAVLRRG